jgi:hypothetical protein
MKRKIKIIGVTVLIMGLLILVLLRFTSYFKNNIEIDESKIINDRYISLYLIIDGIENNGYIFDSGQLLTRISYTLSSAFINEPSNKPQTDSILLHNVLLVVSKPQISKAVGGITITPGWPFNLSQPNQLQNIKLPIFGNVNSSPFNVYDIEIQAEVDGIRTPVMIKTLNMSSLYQVNINNKFTDIKPPQDAIDIHLIRQPLDLWLCVYIPIMLLMISFLYSKSAFGPAIPLLGFIPFRQILIPVDIQGFTLYDIMIVSVLILVVLKYFWWDIILQKFRRLS